MQVLFAAWGPSERRKGSSEENETSARLFIQATNWIGELLLLSLYSKRNCRDASTVVLRFSSMGVEASFRRTAASLSQPAERDVWEMVDKRPLPIILKALS